LVDLDSQRTAGRGDESLRDLLHGDAGSGTDVVHGARSAVERHEAIRAHDISDVAEITHRIDRADPDLVAAVALRLRNALRERGDEESVGLSRTGMREGAHAHDVVPVREVSLEREERCRVTDRPSFQLGVEQIDAQRQVLDPAFAKVDVRITDPLGDDRRVPARDFQHLVGHVDADHFASRADDLGGDETNFSGADEVSWKQIDNFYCVGFTLNGRVMGAAYDAEGQQLCTSRLITREEVPEKLLKRAEGNYRNGKSGPYVLELTYKGETSYYFDIITDRFAIRCMADADGVITEDERMKLQK